MNPVRPRQKGFMLYYEVIETLMEDDYSPEEITDFIFALYRYSKEEIEPSFSDRGLKALWRSTKGGLDRNFDTFVKNTITMDYGQYVNAEKTAYRNANGKTAVEPVVGKNYLSKEAWYQLHWQEYEDPDSDFGTNTGADTGADSVPSTVSENKLEQEPRLEQEQEQELEQNKTETGTRTRTENENRKGNARGRTRDPVQKDPQKLLKAWSTAMESGDLNLASLISNELYTMGYSVNPKTGEVREVLRGSA